MEDALSQNSKGTNMRSIKGRGSTTPSKHTTECCMCGDHGLSHELFVCKLCHFRSQHRYCSNEYPKADSCSVCNWCLIPNDDKAQNSSNSSSLCRNNGDPGQKQKRGTLKLQINGHIKKKILPEKLPPPEVVAGKRVMRRVGGLEERVIIKRSKSEEMSNSGIVTKQVVFRNKVRRYKLLDEVSSL